MLLKNIQLNNIRSYENAEINFPTGSTLLSGDIGENELPLFGKNSKGLKKKKSDNDDMSVENDEKCFLP